MKMQNLPFLQNQHVRDLAWSCFGPTILHDANLQPIAALSARNPVSLCPITLSTNRKQWLHSLDDNPQPLIDYLSTVRSTRLGLYHEALWKFFIEQDSLLSLVTANLAVNHNKKTLGEFDIIYWDKANQEYVHLELAIKFYMQSPLPDTRNTKPYWIGPNCKDRLDIKLSRMLNIQCQLSETEAGCKALKKLNITSVRKELSMKGCLFSAQKQGKNTTAYKWYRWQHVDQLEPLTEYWHILPRSHWISPAYCPAKTEDVYSFDTLKKNLDQQLKLYKRPIIICAMARAKAGYYEQERMFINPNYWPT